MADSQGCELAPTENVAFNEITLIADVTAPVLGDDIVVIICAGPGREKM